MGRPRRILVSGGLYHVTTRGNDRCPIVADDADRYGLTRTISAVVVRYSWICYAWCLMDNHHHLLVETPLPNLADGMCQLNGTYSRRFNRRHQRRDHRFGGRYYAVLIERDRHLLSAARYIVLNRVRAGMCVHPADWPWSSYRALAGIDEPPTFLAQDLLLGQFARDRARARALFVEYVADGLRLAS